MERYCGSDVGGEGGEILTQQPGRCQEFGWLGKGTSGIANRKMR